MITMEELESAITEKYRLMVIECACSFHIGLDISYLEQVGEIIVNCPSCNEVINTEKIKQF